MGQRLSWAGPAGQYLALYERLLAKYSVSIERPKLPPSVAAEARGAP